MLYISGKIEHRKDKDSEKYGQSDRQFTQHNSDICLGFSLVKK